MTRRNARSDSSASISPERLLARALTRRQTLQGAAVGVGALLLAPPLLVPRRSFADEAFKHSPQALAALDSSPLVYVSPLLKDGRESRCHGEVWFMHDEGSVLLCTGTKAWKAEALRKGRDEARIWVGDFGPVKAAGDKYRSAPTFRAKATRELDKAVFDRLIETFGTKYPDGWGKWKPRFEKGWADGSRTLIRYTPTGS